ncbi:MAG: hypothetical protein WBD34_08735 [Burkholderiaceae bacterium]
MKTKRLISCKTTYALATFLLAAALTACGSADNQPVPVSATPAQATTAVISLTDMETPREKTGLIGHSYIDPSLPWLNWNGEPTNIQYDGETRLLNIPAPAEGENIVVGVQRYDRFFGSRRYRLAVTASDPKVAVLIFLFDSSGQNVPIPGVNGPLFVARDGAPLEFDAPATAVGFFVQIQSGWQATDSATLRPSVVDVGNVLGAEFINPRGPWTDWLGQPAPVNYNALINQIWIAPTEDGLGHNLGVQRITNPLIAGEEYELAVMPGTRDGASLLLFLVDAQHLIIPFLNPDTGESQLWLSATGAANRGGAQRFVAPDGVAEIRVQIQGPWNATTPSFIIPSLLKVVTSLSRQ